MQRLTTFVLLSVEECRVLRRRCSLSTRAGGLRLHWLPAMLVRIRNEPSCRSRFGAARERLIDASRGQGSRGASSEPSPAFLSTYTNTTDLRKIQTLTCASRLCYHVVLELMLYVVLLFIPFAQNSSRQSH